MFPQLQLAQQKVQETQRASVPKDRIRRARKFQLGDSVLVYNTQTKMNSSGIVKECKSNNSYIVTIEGRDKHISGDHMRLNYVDNNAKVNDDPLPMNMDDNIGVDDSSDDYFSDNDSIVSDDSDEYMFPQFTNVQNVSSNITNSVSKRYYRNEHEKLKDSLTKEFPASRTRSGRQ